MPFSSNTKKKRYFFIPFLAITVGLIMINLTITEAKKVTTMPTHTKETATFAGGCFWCMQPPYDNLPGIIDTVVGYTGGHTPNPTYKTIITGQTGHAEAVQITFNPKLISYDELLNVFWKNINPTTLNRQFADAGTQYRTAIFYHSPQQKEIAISSKQALQHSKKFTTPIVTTIEPYTHFYPAEKEHQDFYKKHPLRYNRYKQGSGRADYLKKTWEE